VQNCLLLVVLHAFICVWIPWGSACFAFCGYQTPAKLVGRSSRSSRQADLGSAEGRARLLFQEGKYAAAEEAYWKILFGLSASVGESHPTSAKACCNLAACLMEMNKITDAQDVLARAMECQQTNGNDRSQSREVLEAQLLLKESLAQLRIRQGNPSEAEPLLREVLSHPAHNGNELERLRILSNLGVVLEEQDMFTEAREIFQEVLDSRGRLLGLEHPDTLEVASNLAMAIGGQGAPAEAAERLRSALAGMVAAVGETHPRTTTIRNDLAFVLKELGEFEEAKKQYSQVLAWRREFLGPAHPDTVTTQFNLYEI